MIQPNTLPNPDLQRQLYQSIEGLANTAQTATASANPVAFRVAVEELGDGVDRYTVGAVLYHRTTGNATVETHRIDTYQGVPMARRCRSDDHNTARAEMGADIATIITCAGKLACVDPYNFILSELAKLDAGLVIGPDIYDLVPRAVLLPEGHGHRFTHARIGEEAKKLGIFGLSTR